MTNTISPTGPESVHRDAAAVRPEPVEGAHRHGQAQREPVTFTLRGRCVVPGVIEAEALVTNDPISGWGGVDPRTGTVVETRHELRGQCFTGKVLVFPGAKGSSGWSAQFHVARVMGTGPAAWLFNQMSTKIALGAVVSHAPAMTDFDIDPLTVIQTGDWVRVDATNGIVTITRNNKP